MCEKAIRRAKWGTALRIFAAEGQAHFDENLFEILQNCMFTDS